MKSIFEKSRHFIHRLTAPDFGVSLGTRYELRRLKLMPNYVEAKTSLLGAPVLIPDGPSFVNAWFSIFNSKVYSFPTDKPSPRILDCGANIGLASVFFKRLYPNSRITAFEADPKICSYFKGTMAALGITDVELVQKAVWSSNTTLRFLSEGADAGRLTEDQSSKAIEVDAVRLRDYLTEPVDFLKLDIEGAETEALLDCADYLPSIGNIFVEYHSLLGRTQTIDKLLTLLIGAGFRVNLLTEFRSTMPFMHIEESYGMDLRMSISAFRPRG